MPFEYMYRSELENQVGSVLFYFFSTGSASWTFLMTLAGDPTATENAGMLLVTTEPAPIVHPFPIVTPGRMLTLPPIQQSSPMNTGSANSTPSRRD